MQNGFGRTAKNRVNEIDRLAVTASAPAYEASNNLPGARDDDFVTAAARVLRKNAELYRRLA